MITTHYLIITISVFFFSLGGTALAIYLLKHTEILDIPTERSNHAAPVPRGGGLAVTFSILAFMLVMAADNALLLAAAILAAISFFDDAKGLSPRIRLLAQICCVIYALPGMKGLLFHGALPVWADHILVVLLWVWVTNLYNFMDGIDGITGAQTICLAAGLGLVSASVPHISHGVTMDALIMASARLGFLVYNWHPARIFLGDAGSIPLGFLVGYVLYATAASGYWAAALILPAYYFTDSGLTLLKRLITGKKIWLSHSEHYYQLAVRGGRPHDAVVRDIIGMNILLMPLAVIANHSATAAWICVGVAYGASFLFVQYLGNAPRKLNYEITPHA